jgi:hypothetical protein
MMVAMETWELVAREAIRDSLALYTHSGDRFLLDQLAEAFCEDGVLEIRGREPVTGRRAIVEMLAGSTGPDARPPTTGSRRIVRHNLANIRFVALSRGEARVESYFTVVTEIGLDHYGRYRDRFVPVGDRWLIAHRFVSVDWHADGSTFGAGESGAAEGAR